MRPRLDENNTNRSSGSDTDRILVAGGGIGGLSAAIALRQAGFAVDVFERVSQLREIGAGLMINSNGVIALRHLELDQAVLAEAEAARKGFFRWRNGKILFEYPVEQLEREMGAPVLAIHRGRMLQVLKSHFGDEHIHTDSEALGFHEEDGAVVLELPGGRSERGAVLIGADGIHSSIRRLLVGDGAPRYAGYTSWRGITNAVELLEDGLGGETWGPGRRFGYMHIGHGQICWFAMATAPPNGRDEPGKVHEGLFKTFRGWPQQILDLVRSTPQESIIRTDIMDREPIDNWGQGRVTLLGDAAHPMTPNMGQGASQAIEDAVILADSLKRSADWVAGLRLYEQRRKPRTRWFVENSRSFGNFAQVRNPLLCVLRNLMMKMTPQESFVKNLRTALRFTVEPPEQAA